MRKLSHLLLKISIISDETKQLIVRCIASSRIELNPTHFESHQLDEKCASQSLCSHIIQNLILLIAEFDKNTEKVVASSQTGNCKWYYLQHSHLTGIIILAKKLTSELPTTLTF